jgi:hypothetical protein
MAVTFGNNAPSQKTINLDSLFAMSYESVRDKVKDNISSTNAALNALMKSEAYETQDGGTDIEIMLKYANTPMDWYNGYDELSTLPVDGVTRSIWQWRQAAVPVAYSEKERKQNKKNYAKLVTTRLEQAEMGMQEGFATAFMQGAGGSSITTPASSGINGASGIDPLPLLISYNPTVSTEIGNINQNTSSWWRNKTKTSSASTYDGFMLEVDNIFNSCTLGIGGSPQLIICDQTTHELFAHAMYQKYRQINRDMNFQFDNLVYRGAHVVLDEKTPDAANGTVSLTKGTMYFINLKFFHMIYESETDFILTEFQKPVNGDSRIAHILWMGTVALSNRSKQGVMGNIATSLT